MFSFLLRSQHQVSGFFFRATGLRLWKYENRLFLPRGMVRRSLENLSISYACASQLPKATRSHPSIAAGPHSHATWLGTRGRRSLSHRPVVKHDTPISGFFFPRCGPIRTISYSFLLVEAALELIVQDAADSPNPVDQNVWREPAEVQAYSVKSAPS